MRFIRDRLRIARSNSDILGLDIGYSSIKCVVLARNNQSNSPFAYSLKNYASEAILYSKAQTHCIKATLTTAIKQLLAKNSISARYCVVALPDTLVSSKWIRIDSSALENIEIAIHLALEEHIPYPIDAIYFDYQVFNNSQTEDSHYFNVLLVACRKEHLDMRLQVLRQSRLTPLFIEINSHALERAYTHLYASPTLSSYVLIDIGSAHLSIVFLNSAEQLSSYSENIVASDNETVLQKIQHFITTIFLANPYSTQNKLCFIGSNPTLLNFLAKSMCGFCGLITEVLDLDKAPFEIENLKAAEFKKLFPSLFLSIGLALRACVA